MENKKMTAKERRVIRIVEMALFDTATALCVLLAGMVLGKGGNLFDIALYVLLALGILVMRSVFKYLFWDRGTSLTEVNYDSPDDDED